MSENALDRMVHDFAGVLTALTESERVLVGRVRDLRVARHEAERTSPGAAPSRAADALPSPAARTYPVAGPAAAPSQGAASSSPLSPNAGVSALSREQQWPTGPLPAPHDVDPAPQTPAYLPGTAPPAEAPEQPPAAAGHRDYNYFAELDEKLTGLRQRYLE